MFRPKDPRNFMFNINGLTYVNLIFRGVNCSIFHGNRWNFSAAFKHVFIAPD